MQTLEPEPAVIGCIADKDHVIPAERPGRGETFADQKRAKPLALARGVHRDRAEMRGRAIGDQLWRIWTTAPDEAAQDMLDRGRERIRLADYETAESILGKLIDFCSCYGERRDQRSSAGFVG